MHNLQQEIWKDIKGYEGFYKVSSQGRIYSLDRRIPSKAGSTMMRKAKYLVLCNRNGYRAVTLVNLQSDRKQCLIHRLVGEHFIPNPLSLPQINHKDGNKHNNNIENLEWCTHSENMKHSFKIGLRAVTKYWQGKLNMNNCKEVYQYSLDDVFIKKWPSLSEVKRSGLVKEISGISQACSGKMKSYKGFKWKISNQRIDQELKKITKPRSH